MRIIESKDAVDVVDYGINWAGILSSGEEVSTSTWTIPDGLTSNTETNDGEITRIFIGGGTLNAFYDLVNVVVTSGGRTFKETLRLYIRSR